MINPCRDLPCPAKKDAGLAWSVPALLGWLFDKKQGTNQDFGLYDISCIHLSREHQQVKGCWSFNSSDPCVFSNKVWVKLIQNHNLVFLREFYDKILDFIRSISALGHSYIRKMWYGLPGWTSTQARLRCFCFCLQHPASQTQLSPTNKHLDYWQLLQLGTEDINWYKVSMTDSDFLNMWSTSCVMFFRNWFW